MKAPCSLPDVTQAHRLAAFNAMHWTGWTYECAMAYDLRRRLIEARATHMRTEEWKSTQRRSVEPVKRVRLGSDGHPIGWATQMTRGQFVDADFFPTT